MYHIIILLQPQILQHPSSLRNSNTLQTCTHPNKLVRRIESVHIPDDPLMRMKLR